MKKLILSFAMLIVALFLINNVLAQPTFSSSGKQLTINVSRWSTTQALNLEYICIILNNAKATDSCDYVAGIIVMNLNPLNASVIEEVRERSREFADMLEIYNTIVTINQRYGHGSKIFNIPKGRDLVIRGNTIDRGLITFTTDVPVGNLLNPNYEPTRIFVKGQLDYDQDRIVLESASQDKYIRVGATNDRFIPQSTSLTIKPTTGILTIDMSESGKFSIFGIETFIPQGSRLRIATATDFDVYYDHNFPGNIHVSVTPTSATSFLIVRDGNRLWLNGGDGRYALREHDINILRPASAFELVTSYDLEFGVIGRGIRRDGDLSFEPQILRGNRGEILVSKTDGTTTTYDQNTNKWIFDDVAGSLKIFFAKLSGGSKEDMKKAALSQIKK
ncbi:MAG: hypothetical protein QXK80_01915 [Candidatus Pacearchaeota archaeon]